MHLLQEASTTVQQPWEAAVQEADKLQAELEREEQEQSAGPAFVAPSEDDPRKAEHAKNQRVRRTLISYSSNCVSCSACLTQCSSCA